jgi:Mg-chelatase subunit ChlD
MLGMFVCSAAAFGQQDGDGWQDPYLTGDPALYPEPQAAEAVPRSADLTPDPSLAALAADAKPLAAGGNDSVRVELMQVIRDAELAGASAPDGMEAVVLVTRWTNIHPRAQVRKSSLEGKPDRTYGAGRLFSGGGGGAGGEEMVELDVAYKVPKASKHAFLAVGGMALDLNAASTTLPNGVAPGAPFSIARFGESREFRFAYLVPKGANDLAFRLFDYSNGHIDLPVAGDAQAALTGGGPADAQDRGNIGGLEIAVTGVEYATEHGGVAAPGGWRFAKVEVYGRSDAKQGGMGAIATIDPTKYAWLTGDGGYVWYGLPPADGERAVSFTPELFQRRQMVFLVPADAERLRLGLRGGTEVRILKATAESPAPLPPAAVTHADGETLDLALFGLRWEGDRLVADLAVTPKAGAKGVELRLGRQFLIVTGDSEITYEKAVTGKLTRRPPAPAVAPPGTPMRFELAYALPAGAMPDALRYRGFEGEGRLDLGGIEIAGERGQASSGGTTDFPAFKAPEPQKEPEIAKAAPTDAAASGQAGGSSAAKEPSDKRIERAPLVLPAPAGTPPDEHEPNNKFAEAKPLGPDRMARGTLGKGDEDDFFVLTVEGEPQLWAVEVTGANFDRITILNSGGSRVAERHRDGDSDRITLANLYLMPGRHWLHVNGNKKPGDYVIRAVPLGVPDRHDELEPNDDASRAHALAFGVPRRGLIRDAVDKDFYAFSLETPTHLALTLVQPPDTDLNMKLQFHGRQMTGSEIAGPGETFTWRAFLQPGDYLVSLNSNKSFSDTPYELHMDILDPWSLPVDLEPNDEHFEASDLRGNVIEGVAGDFRDYDYFRLPAIETETTLTLTVDSDKRKVSVEVVQYEGTKKKRVNFKEDSKKRTDSGAVFQGKLLPGETYYLAVRGPGAYRIEIGMDPAPATTPAAAADDTAPVLALNAPPPTFAAFRREIQSAELPVTVTNPSGSPQRVRLLARPQRAGWTVATPPDPIELAPGESRRMSLNLTARNDLADGDPATLFLRAETESGAGHGITAPLAASCGAPALSPRPFHPVPEALRGGLNLALSAIGAEPQTKRKVEQVLFDGLAPLGGEVTLKRINLPGEYAVKLAGGGKAPIAGVAILPQSPKAGLALLGPYVISVSNDGKSWRDVHRGELAPVPEEQYAVFDEPVTAGFLKFRFEARAGGTGNSALGLAELKAVAAPGSLPLGGGGHNIAAPAFGGHVVRALPQAGGYKSLAAMLTAKDDVRAMRQNDPNEAVEWVLAFHDNRAARISSLRWREIAKRRKSVRGFDFIEISASLESPLGPWRKLGVWQLGLEPGAGADFVFDNPEWARFLRFRRPAIYEKADWALPDELRVIEQAGDGTYLSILGEWGMYRKAAIFEALHNELADTAGLKSVDAGNERDQALVLENATIHSDSVAIEQDEDWYAIPVAAGQNRLTLTFAGEGAGKLALVLADAAGAPVKSDETKGDDGSRILTAAVGEGIYYLHVSEPPRNIMVVWDNSGSVSSYLPTVYRALYRFFDDVQPGREWVNLIPFQQGEVDPLLDSPSDRTLALKLALNDYDRKDSSSDAEPTLAETLKLLSERTGNKGMLVLTDAASGGFNKSNDVWAGFAEQRPWVFPLELHLSAGRVAHSQDLMQDWASANRGHYAYFRTQGDLDVAFARAICMMRRPAEYSVAAAAEYVKPPKPGTLSVKWKQGQAMAGATVELIFDASGSMRSKKKKNLVGGKLRIDVAREVVAGIVENLPKDVNVGLRVYGHRIREGKKGDCEDSQLVAPIGPLKRKKLLGQVKKIKALGTTPIAYSLLQAGKDLEGVVGPKLILLVTDGKEECNADPAAAAAELRAQGIDVKIDIVGFALNEDEVKQDMLKAAQAGGGAFYDAQDREALSAAIDRSLGVPFDLVDERERVIASGATGGTVEVPPGSYTMVLKTAKGDMSFPDIVVKEASATSLTLSRNRNLVKLERGG